MALQIKQILSVLSGWSRSFRHAHQIFIYKMLHSTFFPWDGLHVDYIAKIKELNIINTNMIHSNAYEMHAFCIAATIYRSENEALWSAAGGDNGIRTIVTDTGNCWCPSRYGGLHAKLLLKYVQTYLAANSVKGSIQLKENEDVYFTIFNIPGSNVLYYDKCWF